MRKREAIEPRKNKHADVDVACLHRRQQCVVVKRDKAGSAGGTASEHKVDVVYLGDLEFSSNGKDQQVRRGQGGSEGTSEVGPSHSSVEAVERLRSQGEGKLTML